MAYFRPEQTFLTEVQNYWASWRRVARRGAVGYLQLLPKGDDESPEDYKVRCPRDPNLHGIFDLKKASIENQLRLMKYPGVASRTRQDVLRERRESRERTRAASRDASVASRDSRAGSRSASGSARLRGRQEARDARQSSVERRVADEPDAREPMRVDQYLEDGRWQDIPVRIGVSDCSLFDLRLGNKLGQVMDILHSIGAISGIPVRFGFGNDLRETELRHVSRGFNGLEDTYRVGFTGRRTKFCVHPQNMCRTCFHFNPSEDAVGHHQGNCPLMLHLNKVMCDLPPIVATAKIKFTDDEKLQVDRLKDQVKDKRQNSRKITWTCRSPTCLAAAADGDHTIN